jgi:hypothetical protein
MTRYMLLVIVVMAMAASPASAAIRIVRTGNTYSTVQAASNACIDGDTIEIDSGDYLGSTACAYFSPSNLTVRGVGATRPRMYANGTSYGGKGIFVTGGNNTTIENLEFYDCTVTSDNGAGIRVDGHGLTARYCYFYNNEMGILSGNWGDDDYLIEYCEFNYNGYTGPNPHWGHNIYIGVSNSATIRYCWTHNSKKGHELKTRAKLNHILYNRIMNQDGPGSYEVDIPIGGTSYVIGNLIHQGINAGNATILTYAEEGATNPDQHLYVVNNTFVNDRPVGTFVNNASTTDALVQNNIFQGPGTTLAGPGTQTTNWQTTNAYLADAANYDYHLTASSTGAINLGTAPGTGINGFNMTPVYQYVHPCSYQGRPVNGTIDIGCYEYGTVGNQAPTVNAGNDQTITLPAVANLDGTVSDDGLPNPPATVTTLWSKVSGPGTVVFGNVYAVDTTATFGQAGTYVLQLLADDSALQSTDTVTITVNAALVDTVASSETPVYGTVTGSYLDTQTSNNVYESIREVIRGSGSLNYSWLEHKWTFSIPINSGLTFYLEAYRPTNSDSDNFTFAYSTNGTTWTNMVTVSKSSDDNLYQTYTLPAGTSGTVYVRVVDTNRQKNKTSLDTVYVDRMFFRSQP